MNELGETYLSKRIIEQETPFFRLSKQFANEEEVKPGPKPENSSFKEKAISVGSDIKTGVLESPTQVVGGVRDGTQEFLDISRDVGAELDNFFGTDAALQIIDPQTGGIDFDVMTKDQAEAVGLEYFKLPEIQDPTSVTGGLIRSVAQFVTGFLPAKEQ